MLKYIPTLLIILRFIIGPLLLLDAFDHQISIWFLIGYIIAFLSDIFDGIIARRLAVSTAKLRQADSWADVCLYVFIGLSIQRVHPSILTKFQIPLLTVVGLQLFWWIVNLVKYGKPASYHTYSAKLWGLTLFIATIDIFLNNQVEFTLWLAIIAGIIHTVEEIIMTLILPEWKHDIASVFQALKIRSDR